jgi:hypothetical protein
VRAEPQRSSRFLLQADPLDLVETHIIASAIIDLRDTRGGMID